VNRVTLPCNGLDKQFGVIARELALRLLEQSQARIVCPVLLNNSPARYEKALDGASVLVIDGCATRCATKLANEFGLRIDDRILISERANDAGIEPSDSLQPTEDGLRLVEKIAAEVQSAANGRHSGESDACFASPTEFLTVTHDKFVFKIPAEGYLFSENDCWVRIVGDVARVGVTDFVQQNLTDITYVELDEIGAEIEQFDEVGAVESGKSMMDVLSPVSGRISSVNSALGNSPELVNQDPYGKGWIAELRLNGPADTELLIDAEAYCSVVRRKAAETGF